ncbi:MAG TPA: hypothetical protein VFJ80_00025 [Candidatus Limnocylindrales bacterium]|nr:hypothetical protein [Candidatus Limnocylindrales bacterium]
MDLLTEFRTLVRYLAPFPARRLAHFWAPVLHVRLLSGALERLS